MKALSEQKIEEFYKHIVAQSGKNTTSFNLFINCEGFEVNYTSRDPESLANEGISMQNLKKEWIK